MIGTRLLHYEITEHVGSGGMGDVYQAADTKLGRSVAIKFLPEAFSHDSARVERFQREARVLASLNHAGIAAIHGLEETNGRHFLVMELVPGETLAQRINRGAIPVEEALPLAKQILEALEEAHEKGVVHRDLKPANIKVTPDGKVKVLDFGLAMAYESQPSPGVAEFSNSPTLSMGATNAGVILGTAAYMSPEQAKGRKVDRRTDIFAFGAVLYEMLAGRPAFDGDDVQEILSAVIRAEPEWNRLPATVPLRIQELLHLCLQKDAKKRRQTATDVRIDIERAMAEPVAPIPVAAAAPPRGSRFAWGVAVAAAIVAAAATFAALRPVPSAPEMRTEIVTPPTSDSASFALSPDGRQLVFVASDNGPVRLWLRPLGAAAAQPLPGTDGVSTPFWSPDSRSVGFFAEGKLKRIDIGGGQPLTLANAVARGGTWNSDGVILFAQSFTGPLLRVSASGGDAVALTQLEKQTSHRLPQFLPDGRQFIFFAQGPLETAGIYLASLDSKEMKRLTPADTAGVYMLPGWLAWVRGGTLVAQRLDLAQKKLTGEPVTLADPVAFDSTYNMGALSSAAGLIAYRTGAASRRQLTWFDRSGKALGVIGAPDENGLNSPRLSPDGRRVAVYRTLQGNTDVWVLDGTRTIRFTFDPALDRNPQWSPDGSRIAFDSNRKGPRNLYIKAASGGGTEELLLDSPRTLTPWGFSMDGRFLLYNVLDDPQTERDLWVLPLQGDHKPWPFLKTSFSDRYGQFSPDGRWVAYESNESGRFEIYIRPFMESGANSSPGNAAGGQWQISVAGGIYVRWRSDGKELYYIDPEGKMMAVPITTSGTALEPGTPVVLFPTHVFGGGVENAQGFQYDVSRDGRFLINTVLDDTASPITLIQNWKPPAK
jgi:eukaryotic-like serine/threonine-protein kinase